MCLFVKRGIHVVDTFVERFIQSKHNSFHADNSTTSAMGDVP